jgi:hypothetical protein
MTSRPDLFSIEEHESATFLRTAEGVWTSDFYQVGDGFSVRVILRRPRLGLPDVTYHWFPHEPNEQERDLLSKDVLTQISSALEIRIFAYYWQAYGMDIDRPKHKRFPKKSRWGPWYTLNNHLWGYEK